MKKMILSFALVALAACGGGDDTNTGGTGGTSTGGTGGANTGGTGGDTGGTGGTTTTSSTGTGGAHQGEVTRGRLVIADGTNPTVSVIDIDEGTVAGTLTLKGTASVNGVTTDPAGLAMLVEAKVNVTEVLSSGISFEEHDGHFHINKGAPTINVKNIPCETPSHLVIHDGWATIFNDGTGAPAYKEMSKIALGDFAMLSYQTAFAHHGVALVFKDMLITTIPDPVEPEPGKTRRPIGVSARMATDPTMAKGEFLGCPLLHGEAASGDRLLFGCSDGALMLTWKGTAFESKHIDNPAGATPGLRVSTVLGAEGLDVFVGNFGGDALSIIDPVAGTITAAALPTTRLAFALFESDHLLVLTLDGKLHKLDPKTGMSQATAIDLIPAYDAAPSGEGAVRPGLVVGVDGAYVSDPRSGKVHEVDVEAFTVGRVFDVGGAPASMQVVSASAGEHMHE